MLFLDRDVAEALGVAPEAVASAVALRGSDGRDVVLALVNGAIRALGRASPVGALATIELGDRPSVVSRDGIRVTVSIPAVAGGFSAEALGLDVADLERVLDGQDARLERGVDAPEPAAVAEPAEASPKQRPEARPESSSASRSQPRASSRAAVDDEGLGAALAAALRAGDANESRAIARRYVDAADDLMERDSRLALQRVLPFIQGGERVHAVYLMDGLGVDEYTAPELRRWLSEELEGERRAFEAALVLGEDPDDPGDAERVGRLRGQAGLTTEKFEQARPARVLAHLEQRVRAGAADPTTRLAYAGALDVVERRAEAVDVARALLDEHPGAPEYVVALSRLLDGSNAIELLESGARRFPSDPLVRYELGSAYDLDRNDARALEHYEAVYVVSPTGDVLGDICDVLERMGSDELGERLRELETRYPEHHEARKTVRELLHARAPREGKDGQGTRGLVVTSIVGIVSGISVVALTDGPMRVAGLATALVSAAVLAFGR